MPSSLTPHQKRVLRLAAQGLSIPQIAQRVGSTEGAVSTAFSKARRQIREYEKAMEQRRQLQEDLEAVRVRRLSCG